MMATATATAPTEQEIRDVVLRRASDDYPGDDPRKTLREAIESWGNVLTEPAWVVLEGEDPRDPSKVDALDLWIDLRASEAVDLRALAKKAIDEAYERCQAIIVEELVAAGVRFAEQHPDTPRPDR
jgi:hypothetical protein